VTALRIAATHRSFCCGHRSWSRPSSRSQNHCWSAKVVHRRQLRWICSRRMGGSLSVLPRGPPALDCQLMEPWPWFTTPLTLPVAEQGTRRPSFHLSHQLPANSLKAHSRIHLLGQRRRLSSPVRRTLRIVSKRLLSCSHPRCVTPRSSLSRSSR
jgi:hypothetical protein